MFILSRNTRICILILGICFTWFALSFPGEKSGRVLAAEEKEAGKKSTPFWQRKGTQEWSPEEVRVFLEASPWAKTEKIVLSIKNVWDPTAPQSPRVAGAVQTMKIESCCRTFEVPMPGSNADSATDPQGGRSPDFSRESSRTWTFSARVSWISSVSIRRAMIRQRQLQGMPMEQSEAALAPSSDFVLALSGSFLKLLEGLPSDQVKTISFIRAARGTKRKLSPAEYIPPKPDADPVAFLIFPKTLEGRPIFSREDGLVTFFMKGIDFELECRFPLEPMVIDGKLDW